MTTLARWTRGLATVAALAITVTTAHAQSWYAVLNGPSESPPNSSLGTGFARFTLTGNLLSITGTFTGLSGGVSASHIHCCTTAANAGTAGVATTTPTFTGFPSGVTSGTFNLLLDLTQSSSWNAAFITSNGGTTAGAMQRMIAGFNAGTTYLNIHTSAVPSGEIRGFITVVPEPSGLLLMGTGLLGLVVITTRRKHGAR